MIKMLNFYDFLGGSVSLFEKAPFSPSFFSLLILVVNLFDVGSLELYGFWSDGGLMGTSLNFSSFSE